MVGFVISKLKLKVSANKGDSRETSSQIHKGKYEGDRTRRRED